MPYYHSNGLKYYRFPLFEGHGVIHAALTRQGGISPSPWDSLNLGGTVGDDSARVFENRKRAFEAVQLSFDSLFDVWQVHSDRVVVANTPRLASEAIQQADAILTNKPDVTLFMRFADCVPIYLYDPCKRVVGLAHAGWVGTIKRITGKAVRTMVATFGCQPDEIIAGIGPSIAAHHYPVGADVVTQVRAAFGTHAESLLFSIQDGQPETGVKFDLWEANRLILEQEGVKQVELSGLCTACHTEDWYSHRSENGRTGRFGALIALPK